MINTNKLIPKRRGASNVLTTETVENLGIVRKKLIKADDILKEDLVLTKVRDGIERRKKEREKRMERESTLEKSGKGMSKFKKFMLPGVSIFTKAFNLIVASLIAPFFGNVIKFLPKIIAVMNSTVFKVGKFIVTSAAKIFMGIVGGANTLYTKLRNSALQNFGEKGVKAFDDIFNIVIKFINYGLIAGMLAFKMMEFQRLTLRRGLQNVVGGRNLNKKLMMRFMRRFGRSAAIDRFGRDAVRQLPGKFGRSATKNLTRNIISGLFGRSGSKTLIRVLKPLSRTIRNIPFIGPILEFLLRVFLFKEPLGQAAFLTTTSGIGAALGALIGSLVPGPGTIIGGILGGMAGDAIGRGLFKFFFPNNLPKVPSLVDEGQTGFKEVDQLSPENQAAYDEMVRGRNIAEETGSIMGGIEETQFVKNEKAKRMVNKQQVSNAPVKTNVKTVPRVFRFIKKVSGKQFGGSILSGNIDSDKYDALMESMYYDKRSSRVVVQPVITERTVVNDMKGQVSRNSLLMSLGNGFNLSNIFYERGSHS